MKRSKKRELQPKLIESYYPNSWETQLLIENIKNEMLEYDVELYKTMLDIIYNDINANLSETVRQYQHHGWLFDLRKKAEKILDEDKKI